MQREKSTLSTIEKNLDKNPIIGQKIDHNLTGEEQMKSVAYPLLIESIISPEIQD